MQNFDREILPPSKFIRWDDLDVGDVLEPYPDSRVQMIRWFLLKLQDPNFIPTLTQSEYLLLSAAKNLAPIDEPYSASNLIPNSNELFPGHEKLSGRLCDAEGQILNNNARSDYIVPPNDSKLKKFSEFLNPAFGISNEISPSEFILVKAALSRIRGSKQANDFTIWFFDHYELITGQLFDDDRLTLLEAIYYAWENRTDDPENQYVSLTLVNTFQRLVTHPPNPPNEKWVAMIDSLLGGPSTIGYPDMRQLFYRGIALLGDRARETSGYFLGIFGLANVISDMKQVQFSDHLGESEKQAAYRWLLDFWENIVPIRNGQIHLNEMAFYDAIPEESLPMTETREGSRRISMILDIFRHDNIRSTDLILDVAGGNGWLAQALIQHGYDARVIDLNARYLEAAKGKIGPKKVYQGDMTQLNSTLEKHHLDPKVIIINGRSIHHIHNWPDLDGIFAPLVIFDALDPTTGVQAQMLDKLRSKLTTYGYNRDWLDLYFWHILGSIDNGNNLGDRWAPPEEWWRDYWEASGYIVDTIKELNYDNHNTDNIVYICRYIKNEKLRQQHMRTADIRRYDRFLEEPNNPQLPSFDAYRGYSTHSLY